MTVDARQEEINERVVAALKSVEALVTTLSDQLDRMAENQQRLAQALLIVVGADPGTLKTDK